jgi:hypothetical protein
MLSVTETPDVELVVTETELDKPVESETLVDRDMPVSNVDEPPREEYELGYGV